MSVVRPFRGLRPRPNLAGEVASPPYDVLSSDEARELTRNNPNSFLRVNKPEVDFDPDTPLYSETVYKRGKENLHRLISEKIMVRDETACFYLYRLTWRNQSQTGLVALTSVDEYDQGLIKKHEHTRPEKVNDRANHILTVQAQVGPVFSIFRHNDDTGSLFERLTVGRPEVDFTADDGVRHELWVISDKQSIDALREAFARLDELYVADGHHRSQSASEVRRRLREDNPDHTGEEIYDYFLNVVFPDNELRILPYNRVVNDLGGLELEEVLAKASRHFEVVPSGQEVSPAEVHQFGLYCDGKWYRLTAKEGSFDKEHPSQSIDAAVLSKNFLRPILGITDVRTDKRIDFVGGIRGISGLVRLVNSGMFKIAFSLYPVSVGQLLAVADAGEVMPPKSTWFEPKLRSGMVVNFLKD